MARHGRTDEQVNRLLDEAAEAFDDERPRDVLRLTEKALALDPGSVEALHYQAAAHRDLEDLEASEATFRRALKLAPEDPELLLGFADLLISHSGDDRTLVEEGLAVAERGRKKAAKEKNAELEYELLLLEGIGHNQLGECELALEKLDAALKLEPGSIDAAVEHAIALFELCRFDAAEKELRKIVASADDEPFAHHYLGLVAERRKDHKEAKRRFQKAQELSPEDFPDPVRLSDEEFDKALHEAVERLPEHVKKHLENVTISVEDIPQDEDLLASRPPLSPSILGVFRGTPVGERSVSSAYDHFPAAIVLYQRNLERFARTRDELLEQIGITVMHEVGHLIGLDEEDLWERGLE